MKMRSRAIGGLTLAGLAAGLGIWTLVIAPGPPAAAAAIKEVRERRFEVREVMDEILAHEARARTALASDQRERALAHLIVMDELVGELRSPHLKISEGNLEPIADAIRRAIEAARKGDPAAGTILDAMRVDCTRCHATMQGPGFGTVEGPALPATERR